MAARIAKAMLVPGAEVALTTGNASSVSAPTDVVSDGSVASRLVSSNYSVACETAESNSMKRTSRF